MARPFMEQDSLEWPYPDCYRLADTLYNFDPNQPAPPEQVGALLLSLYGVGTYHNPNRLIGSLAGDAYESGALDRERALGWAIELGDGEVALESLDGIDAHVELQARGIVRNIPAGTPPDKRALVAANMMAINSYGEKRRKSGRLYYEHPREVAAMVYAIMRDLQASDDYDISDSYIQRCVITALLHDGVEESIRSFKYYDPKRPETFSPLLVRRVMEKLHVPDAREIASDLYLLTHPKKIVEPGYLAYVGRGSTQSIVFGLIKRADQHHNSVIEPKPLPSDPDKRDKIRKRQREYDISKVSIPEVAKQLPGCPPWADEYFYRLNKIESVSADMVEQLDKYILAA